MAHLIRVSEAANLGMHAATLLAEDLERSVPAKELARRLEASEAHMAKVMQRLVKAGLVTSTRGPKGGFKLARPPAEITQLEVFEAVEGTVEPTHCLLGRPMCHGECIFGDFISEMDRRFRETLANTRLDALQAKED